MLPWSAPLAGRLDEQVIDSPALRGNPLGDPSERPLWVYLPPGYDASAERRYPSIYVIQGYTGHLAMWRNRTPYRQPFIETADAVLAGGQTPPAIVVYVDAWTAYGGSQFVDSPGTGRYHSYLCDDVVSYVDARYRTLNSPQHRGIMGKSSGGFGAFITPMLRPDIFGGLASHAGDSLYELSYLREFAECVRYLRDYDADIWKWWADFNSRTPFTKKADNVLLITLGCAACFSADDGGTPQLPFDPRTGQLIDERWNRWLAWDPVRMVSSHADALRAARAIWIDAGKSDEWYLDLGAEAMRAELAKIGVSDVQFELFEGTHMAIDYRYPMSLAYLASRLAGD
jgi:S-formylglutathione hydrolase FrmB